MQVGCCLTLFPERSSGISVDRERLRGETSARFFR